MARPIPDLDPMTAAEVATDDQIIIDDTSAGETKRIPVGELLGLPKVGWTAAGEVWSFSSWNNTTKVGVVNVPSNATTKYGIGMFVMLTQATGGLKFAKILSLTTTTLTLWLPGFTLNNETITTPFYSPLAHPQGLPIGIAEGNPYRFGAYRTTAGSVNGTDVAIAMNIEDYDTNSNYNEATGLFTAPVAGQYDFFGQITFTATSSYAWGALFKNGAVWHRGNRIQSANGAAISTQHAVGGTLDLAAGDTVAIGAATGNNNPLESANRQQNYFYGKLVSRS